MKSQWYELKSKAIAYRRKGYSLRMVEHKLGIRRSTLSYWFKDVVLTSEQKAKLLKNWGEALGKARVEAVKWHNKQKAQRLALAKSLALDSLSRINTNDKDILELALAMLYLGEGSKKSPETRIGSSDVKILKFFISGLEEVYNFDPSTIHCDLHLRADQNSVKMKKFWSRELQIPLKNFISTAFDKRTEGSVTYSHYKGVCVLNCGAAAIQRRLLYLADEFCEKVINK